LLRFPASLLNKNGRVQVKCAARKPQFKDVAHGASWLLAKYRLSLRSRGGNHDIEKTEKDMGVGAGWRIMPTVAVNAQNQPIFSAPGKILLIDDSACARQAEYQCAAL
jgi:hypothetical protein